MSNKITKRDGQRQTESRSQESSLLYRGASFVTLAIKVTGLAIAAHEALVVDPPRDSVVFAVAAFMMAGATGLDNIIDKFLGGKGS